MHALNITELVPKHIEKSMHELPHYDLATYTLLLPTITAIDETYLASIPMWACIRIACGSIFIVLVIIGIVGHYCYQRTMLRWAFPPTTGKNITKSKAKEGQLCEQYCHICPTFTAFKAEITTANHHPRTKYYMTRNFSRASRRITANDMQALPEQIATFDLSMYNCYKEKVK